MSGTIFLATEAFKNDEGCFLFPNILPNISRGKGNQTIKFGELMEYNMRNIFLKNHTQDAVEKLSSDPFLEKQNCTHL